MVTRLTYNILSRSWARGKLRHISPCLPPGGSLLDIGAGRGAVSDILQERGYRVTALDVKDRSLTSRVRPLLYDGVTLPFADDSFDCGLLLTVLHHTPRPVELLCEAARVCRRLIVIEDVYSNRVQKYLTFFMDSLVNAEFFGHPHSNATDARWRTTFDEIGLSLDYARDRRVLLFFRQVAYGLNRKGRKNG